VTGYQPRPRYPILGGEVERGFAPLVRELVARRPAVLAVDGPATIDWAAFGDGISAALAGSSVTLDLQHSTAFLAERVVIEERALSGPLREDPVFAPLFDGQLGELFSEVPRAMTRPGADRAGEVTLLMGPGAALADHDLLWVVDHPKRVALAAVRSGSAAPIAADPGDPDSERRLTFLDWPVLDHHRRALVPRLDRFIDAGEPTEPRSLGGDPLRASLASLAAGPFRTLPTFAPGPWGGQWLRRELGVPGEGPNLAWSYELIAPESSVLLGDEPALEVGLEMVLGQAARQILGGEVDDRFEGGFPIRFDYLDTIDGDHLSVHCHPQAGYMDDVFGWPYAQHESYYLMATSPGSFIFLGLREEVDEIEFRAAAERSRSQGRPLDIERYVQTHPARCHQLYLVPAGTPHASSAGNVVLEISATPYLYSLRFYDWLRQDLRGKLRPVQLEHAFANLGLERRGEAVRRDLVQEPRVVRAGSSFVELELGRHPELFFVVRRIDLEPSGEADDDTAGVFHVLNLVEGDAVEIETAGGRRHQLAYAETVIVPASVGAYRIRSASEGGCRVVKALVASGD
jgi:hypothetical protein